MELLEASRRRDIEKVKKLLSKGESPNFENNGMTALMHASGNGHIEMVELLLATGESHPERQDKNDKNTALINASANGRTKIVELLLATGESHPEYQNVANKTALVYAQQYGYIEIVNLIENYRPFEFKSAAKRK